MIRLTPSAPLGNPSGAIFFISFFGKKLVWGKQKNRLATL